MFMSPSPECRTKSQEDRQSLKIWQNSNTWKRHQQIKILFMKELRVE
jgi:hypothetical protein